MLNKLLSGILAGCSIAIGAYLYLKIGEVIGALLFSVGLLCVLSQGFLLFTGQAWKYSGVDILKVLLPIIIGNIIGCGLLACISQGVVEPASQIIQSRISAGWFNVGVFAIPCGFLMTSAVRSDNLIITILCVGAFIICGFPHCVADVFYYTIYGQFTIETLWIYIATIIGNYIGCNAYRITNIKIVKHKNICQHTQ